MIDPSDALDRIDNALGRLWTEEGQMELAIRTLWDRTEKLQQERVRLYKALAQIRLDSLDQGKVVEMLTHAEENALRIFRDTKQKIVTLDDRRQHLAGSLAQLNEKRRAIAQRLTDALEKLSRLEQAAAEGMQDHPPWKQHSAQIADYAARAQSARSKVAEATIDLDTKYKAYIADPLFSYLWLRQYGTNTYKANPLARLGDNFVARVADFGPALRNFLSLLEMPKRLEEYAARLEAAGAAEKAKLEATELEFLQGIEGYGELQETRQRAEAELDTIDLQLSGADKELGEVDAERQSLTEPNDNAELARALNDLARSFANDDLPTLRDKTLQTADQEDDEIVRRLRDIEEELDNLVLEEGKLRRRLRELEAKREELKSARNEFLQARYEQQGGSFSNDQQIRQTIDDAGNGTGSSSGLGELFSSSYNSSSKKASPNPWTKPGSSSSSTKKSRSSSSTSTGGGFGGGGAKTGGGF